MDHCTSHALGQRPPSTTPARCLPPARPTQTVTSCYVSTEVILKDQTLGRGTLPKELRNASCGVNPGRDDETGDLDEGGVASGSMHGHADKDQHAEFLESLDGPIDKDRVDALCQELGSDFFRYDT